MARKKEIWDQIKKKLESVLSSSEYRTWFQRTKLQKLDPIQAVIEVPNRFFASWIHEKYLGLLREFFEAATGASPEIHFSYCPGPTPQSQLQPTRAGMLHTFRGLSPVFDPSLTFSGFITGKCNRFAYHSALAVAERLSSSYNPFFIFANFSGGKTHLLHAIGNHILAKNPKINIRYLSSERFISDLSYAIKNKRVSRFREAYSSLDAFLLDDVHLLSGRRRSQQEMTNLFNSFYESQRQIVITSKNPPHQIQDLSEPLRSRLQWGLMSEIRSPDQKTKVEIIKRRSLEEGVQIPDDVCVFLAKASTDLKVLIRNLIRLITYSSLYERPMDISTLRTFLKSSQWTQPQPQDIQQVAATFFDIPLSSLISNEKRRSLSYPRQLAMYLCRKYTALSYKQIGEAFGNKDHSTVIYAVRRIEQAKKEKKGVADDLAKLEKLIA